MALVTWTPKMSVGIEKIDKEHQTLFSIINRLHEAMLSGKGKDVAGEALAELLRYTKIHFGDEEALLRLHRYPQLAEHLKSHEVFRNKVAELEAQLKVSTAVASISTLDFLRDWLAKHILGTDMQYKDFLAYKGVK